MNDSFYKVVEETAKELYIRALKKLPPDVKEALQKAEKSETTQIGKEVLKTILKNIEVAEENDMLVCQDTGLAIYMVKIGSNISVDGARITQALNEGCKRATLEYPLRSSVTHTITRQLSPTGTGEKIPVIYYDFMPDADYVEILAVPKGSGSENMSALEMFIPAAGIKAVKKFILDSVVKAGANPCPPIVVGVGLGGTAELCMKIAKEAIARPIGSHNSDPEIAALEDELTEAINSTGIGPMGLGGSNSCLAVHIETAHTHITLNPVAINIQCWPARRARARIYSDAKVTYGF